jgi:hypothetical protein
VAYRGRDVANKGWMAECTGWVLVITGILLAVTAGREAALLFVSADSWAQAEATVLRTHITPAKGSGLALFGDRKSGFAVGQDFVYFRKGHRHQGSVLLGTYESEQDAQLAVETATRPGRTRRIWVDAANPTQVRLDQTQASEGWPKAFFLKIGLRADTEQKEAVRIPSDNVPNVAPGA